MDVKTLKRMIAITKHRKMRLNCHDPVSNDQKHANDDPANLPVGSLMMVLAGYIY
jgi:hypothetical protein